MKRNDCHRPGAIIPRDYVHVLSYSLPGSDEPGVAHQAAIDMWLSAPADRRYGSPGQCGVCGARFRHGDLYRHAPTGDLVAMGHDCADKYAMVAERDDWCAELEAVKRGRAARLEAMRREERYAAFCDQHEGLAEILAMDHEILRDMAQKLRRFGSLSDRQVAFARKLADEIQNPKPHEVHVPAPEGRVTVRGVLVSKKLYDGLYGSTLRMTVKVVTPNGVWLAWGTMPVALSEQCPEIGTVVEFQATLARGRDEHFAIFKRPSKAKIGGTLRIDACELSHCSGNN